MIACVVAADLAHIAEVFEHGQDGFQNPAQRLAAVIRLEDDGTAEDHILAQQGDGGVEITGFDRATERMHHLTTSLIN
jgi:hypothetical protein